MALRTKLGFTTPATTASPANASTRSICARGPVAGYGAGFAGSVGSETTSGSWKSNDEASGARDRHHCRGRRRRGHRLVVAGVSPARGSGLPRGMGGSTGDQEKEGEQVTGWRQRVPPPPPRKPPLSRKPPRPPKAHDQRGAVAIAGTADDEYWATRARGGESAARERSNGRPAPCTMPHCGVKTTRGGDSHFDPPATHTGTSAYPQAR